MAWSDIDFGKIVSGAIVTGDTESSFADILTEFVTALRERAYLIKRENMNNARTFKYEDSEGNTKYGFRTGEICNQGDFVSKYRILIGTYHDQYFGVVGETRTTVTWLKEGVKSDLRNPTLYYYDNDDFLELFQNEYGEERGQEVYNYFKNPWSYPISEIFSADVINGMYLMYGAQDLYRDYATGIWSENYPRAGAYRDGVASVRKSYSLWGNYGSFENFTNILVNDLNSFNVPNAISANFGITYTISTDNGGVRYQKASATNNAQDNIGFKLKQLKLDDTPIVPIYDLQFTIYNNYVKKYDWNNGYYLVTDEAYWDDAPYRGGSMQSPWVILEPTNEYYADGALIKDYNVLSSGTGYVSSADYPTPLADIPNKRVECAFSMGVTWGYIYANNPELDYYIAP